MWCVVGKNKRTVSDIATKIPSLNSEKGHLVVVDLAFVCLYWGYTDWTLIPSIRNQTSFKSLLSISISAWINVFMDKTSILIWNVGRLYKANNLYKTQSIFFHITKNWQSLQKSYFSNWNSQNEIHRQNWKGWKFFFSTFKFIFFSPNVSLQETFTLVCIISKMVFTKSCVV